MPRFLYSGCVLLLAACTAIGPLAAQEPGKEPPIKQPSLIELAKLYKDLDLPLPPKDAFFAVSLSVSPPFNEDPHSPEIEYRFQFASGGPYPKAKYQVWAGFKESPQKNLFLIFNKAPSPETVLRYLKMDPLPRWGSRLDGLYANLVLAIQCHLLQHFELAKFFYSRHLKWATEPSHQSLVKLAWNHWIGELTRPKRDRAAVARKLHLLVDKHGFLEGMDEETHQRHQELLNRLELTLKSVPANPGSIEALIDQLVDDSQIDSTWSPWLDDVVEPDADGILKEKPQANQDPLMRELSGTMIKLRNLGFEGIAPLIDHVDNQRLVLVLPPPLQNFYVQGDIRFETLCSHDFPSVGTSVRKILSTFFDLDPIKATKADYLNSWKKIKGISEADFVAKTIDNIQDLNINLTRFISEKYKTQAYKAYEIMLLKNVDFQHSDLLLDSIVASDLFKPAKVDLLTRGARSAHVRQKLEALKRLLKLDSLLFSHVLSESLDKMAWKGDGGEGDRYRVRLVALAFQTEDLKLRKSVEKYVKGLPANQMLAVMKELGSDQTLGSHLLDVLSFLCQFLDDKTVYQDPTTEKAGFNNLDRRLREVEVGDFAALQILKHMGIDILTNSRNVAPQWDAAIDFAKEEVNRRLENKKQQ